ncbi:hypothetical protein CKAH01_00478 [Colletotrichum kahawae]|uniref:Uncharacterized protein n=1 Tax=Colletotrichum kahawae TaxID=34407 RepID=A0AAD9YZG6_COLKA|nr:hypothetical protein CKAH01_00478 [Colletotrichum kahawae]
MQTGNAADLRGKEEDQSINGPRQDTAFDTRGRGQNTDTACLLQLPQLTRCPARKQQIDRLWPMQLDGVIRACHSFISGFQTKGASLDMPMPKAPINDTMQLVLSAHRRRRPLFPPPGASRRQRQNCCIQAMDRRQGSTDQCPGRLLTAFDGLQTGSRHGTFRRMQPRYVPGDKHLVGFWFRAIL